MGPVALTLAAAMALAGPDRPRPLLGSLSQAEYADWLAKAAIEAEDIANGSGSEACAKAQARSLEWWETADPYVAPMVVRYSSASVVEKVRVQGCGRDHVQTLVTFRIENGFEVVRLAQGESLAPVRATWEAADLVAKEAWAKSNRHACSVEDSLRMGDTRLVSRPSAGEWTELWPVTVCGKPQVFSVRFKATSAGGHDIRIERAP